MKLLIYVILWLWDHGPIGYVIKSVRTARELRELSRDHRRLLGDLRDLHFWFNEREHPQLVLGTGWALRRHALRQYKHDGAAIPHEDYEFLDGIEVDRLRDFINLANGTAIDDPSLSLTEMIKKRRDFWKSLKAVV